jgi:hypothetical protein
MQVGQKETIDAVHGKRLIAALMLAAGAALAGCANALPSEATSGNPLLTTTPVDGGLEPRGVETAPDTGEVQPATTASAEAPVEAPATGVEVAPTEAAPAEAPPPEPVGEPTVNPAFGSVQLPSAADLEGRWRDMQVDRAPFEAPRTFVSSGSEIVWWFDPLYGQLVPIGEIRGEFVAQASFRIKGQWIGALEIPYQVNQAYGIVVPDPILQRMRNAGKGEWAEVFVYQTGDVSQR